MNKKQIVFVKQNPQMRVYKQAAGLARTGKYELVLLCYHHDAELFHNVFDTVLSYRPPGAKLAKIRVLKDIFNRIELFNDRLSLAKRIRSLDPMLFHAHAEPNIAPAIVMENTKRPVIYDAYDYAGLRFGIDSLSESEREAEKFALENASGITTKFTEEVLQFYRSYGYTINCPSLEFRDYCLTELCILPPKTKQTTEDEIHLVYTGVIASSQAPLRFAGNNQVINIALRVIQPKLWFHIYPNPWQYSKQFQDYFEADSSNPTFVFHKPLKQRDLQLEISNYHYGCNLHDFSQTAHTKLFEATSIGVKFFSYLEAGLPVIVSSNLKLNAKVALENEVGVTVDLNELENLYTILQDIDYNRLRENVIKAREGALNMDNNIGRLEKFYSEIA